MYQYKQQSSHQGSRRKRGANYILPFVIIALLIGIIWAAWSLISRVWVSDNQNNAQQAARLMIDSGSVKVMMADQEAWGGVVGDVDVYSGEKVKIGADGQASLFFSSDMELRLNRSAEVGLTQFDKNEGSSNVKVQIDKGLTWASLGNLATSNSTFELTTQYLSINADSAKFAVEAPGTVYMLEGNGSVEIMDGDKPIKSLKLGVGQQLVVDEKTIASLNSGVDEKLIFAMDDDFKRTGFYLWNAEQEGWTASGEETSSATEDSTTKTDDDTTKTEDSTTKTDDDTTTDTKDEPVVSGKVEITSPSKEATYESNTMDFNLEGNVPSNTAKVVINGSYTLQQYKAGSTTAKYYVRKDTGNVKEGKNIYSITAYDKDDKKIGEDSITVNVKAAPTEDKPAENTNNTTSGTVSITSPSANATYESTTSTFDIKATVPGNSAKVVVNDYTLGGYSAGSTSAVYHVKSANGNVKEGENNYTVTAYDKDNTKIGQDTITVTVKSSSTATQPSTSTQSNTLTLTFNTPSTSGTYSTTLSPIKIGGAASADIRNLYLNDSPLSSHSLGNTAWEKLVDLSPGLNTFKIYGENGSNESTGVKTLTIDYQVL